MSEIDKAKEKLEKLLVNNFSEYKDDLSETDTRCKLIDEVLIDVMGWLEPAIVREPHVSQPFGYIDYVLHTSRPAYVVEAKKRSVRFLIPSTKKGRSFKVGGVLAEDKELLRAIRQCKAYGISKGTSFCCVTNGEQYVFFRSHSDLGLEFDSHHAIVFDGVEDLLGSFQQFYSLISFESVSEGRHYSALPVAEIVDVSSRFKELSAQPLGIRYKNRNRLEPFIRDVVTEVFQDLAGDSADIELIEQCYVESPSQGSYEQSLKAIVRNKPGLADGKVFPVRVGRRTAGEFDKVLDSAARTKVRPAEVIMLLGGIGAGKTTFLSRFRKVIARERIDESCFWVDVNFNKYSESPDGLDKWVADEIISSSERGYPSLGFGSYSHLRQAYHQEYERLKVGRLAPIFQNDPSEFEIRFSGELEKLEANSISHVIKLLKAVQKNTSRRVFLVFDNADQFSAKVQNDVFMLANRMSTEVGCSLIVSLREESYWKNKDYGALSAFHSVNFYVDSPDLKQVIAKRFRYASELLRAQKSYVVPSGGLGVTEAESVLVFESIRNTVLEDPRFVRFLEDLSPGEVRRPLDQLSRFLFSGHTNIDSILRGLRGNLQIRIGFHEFVKSVALGDRELFSESRSDIINLYSLDGSLDASNLHRLAILGYLQSFRRDKSERGLGYVPFEQVIDACSRFGISADTAQSVIELLNARRLIETDRQIREEIESSVFIRTTKAFDYYLSSLAGEFTYVDLVIPGTLMPQGTYFDMIERISQQIYSFDKHSPKRIEKIELRIERARAFSRFISDEAGRHGMFMDKTAMHESVKSFVKNMELAIDRQAEIILENAKRIFSPMKK